MTAVIKKDEAHRIIDQLPAGAAWEDLMRENYVCEAIENGMEDSRSGQTRSVNEIRSQYGLPE